MIAEHEFGGVYRVVSSTIIAELDTGRDDVRARPPGILQRTQLVNMCTTSPCASETAWRFRFQSNFYQLDITGAVWRKK